MVGTLMVSKLRLIKQHHRCEHCLFRRFFLNVGLNCDQIDQTGQSTTSNIGPYLPGEYLYRMDDPCKALYVVHAGSVKTEILTPDGDLHISGFYLTGELFGAEGIHQRRFGCDAIALEKTWVCELTLDNWGRLSQTHPKLQRELATELSRIIAHKEYEAVATHYHRLEQRLMSFLMDLLERVSERKGHPMNEIKLSMTKTDIARYLGATLESVSRTFTKLEKTGHLINDGRSIRILKRLPQMDKAI